MKPNRLLAVPVVYSLWRETHRRSWREDGKNGNEDYLIEEEEGVNDESVVAKCAEIQTAISEGD